MICVKLGTLLVSTEIFLGQCSNLEFVDRSHVHDLYCSLYLNLTVKYILKMCMSPYVYFIFL